MHAEVGTCRNSLRHCGWWSTEIQLTPSSRAGRIWFWIEASSTHTSTMWWGDAAFKRDQCAWFSPPLTTTSSGSQQWKIPACPRQRIKITRNIAFQRESIDMSSVWVPQNALTHARTRVSKHIVSGTLYWSYVSTRKVAKSFLKLIFKKILPKIPGLPARIQWYPIILQFRILSCNCQD